SNDISPAQLERINAVIDASGIITGTDEATTTSAMTRPEKESPNSAFIDIKAVEPTFPLVGDFRLSDGEPFDHAMLRDNGAITARTLLEDLDINIGDKIYIGNGVFTVRGTFDEEPGGT